MKVSPDLQQARVYYTTLGDEKARRETARALERATPFLRRHVGRRLRLKRVPELTFSFDESIEKNDRIERILQELERTGPRSGPSRPEPGQDDAMPTSRETMSSEPAGRRRRRGHVRETRSATKSCAAQRFLLTSHARPDGDSIGSQLAMAFALDALGKQVRIVNADAAPDHYRTFPAMDRIEIARSGSTAEVDAVIVMECGDLGAHGRRGARGAVPRSTSITIPATACTARSTGSTKARRRAARWCSI